MQFQQIDPHSDIDRLRQCFEITSAAQLADDPQVPVRSFDTFASRWRYGMSGDPRQGWLATDDFGQPVGCYLLILPARENPTMALSEPTVSPELRRQGAGTTLLAHCAGQAREAGRTRLAGEAREGSAGDAFAAAAGAASGITEVIRRLDLDSGFGARLAGLRAETAPRSAGYSVVSWSGASPADTLDDQAALSMAMNDAPRDEGVEPEEWDADRITGMEQAVLSGGMRLHTTCARDEKSGRLTALSQVCIEDGTPGWAFQMMTAVLPGHRGHRLGLLVKVAMLELLATVAPDVRHILTGNAGSNQHMIAINDMLGFRISSSYRSWELQLTP